MLAVGVRVAVAGRRHGEDGAEGDDGRRGDGVAAVRLYVVASRRDSRRGPVEGHSEVGAPAAALFERRIA